MCSLLRHWKLYSLPGAGLATIDGPECSTRLRKRLLRNTEPSSHRVPQDCKNFPALVVIPPLQSRALPSMNLLLLWTATWSEWFRAFWDEPFYKKTLGKLPRVGFRGSVRAIS